MRKWIAEDLEAVSGVVVILGRVRRNILREVRLYHFKVS